MSPGKAETALRKRQWITECGNDLQKGLWTLRNCNDPTDVSVNPLVWQDLAKAYLECSNNDPTEASMDPWNVVTRVGWKILRN